MNQLTSAKKVSSNHQTEVAASLIPDLRQARMKGSSTLLIISGSSQLVRQQMARQIAVQLHTHLAKVSLESSAKKYIGETEKNLSQQLKRAAQTKHILFFDEADALFGKRTGRRGTVKDSHDRYANSETNYLLRALHQHRGLVIVAGQRANGWSLTQWRGNVIRVGF